MEIDINDWKDFLGAKGVKMASIKTSFDLSYQRVIKTDVLRTKTGVLSEYEMQLLETLLTFYCKDTDTVYKQGMNEIFAPFLLMMRNGLTLEEAYVMGKNFIHACLDSMFRDDDFKPAQAMFLIVQILLKYINPTLSLYLEKSYVTPELYATSWFLTLFQSKIPKMENVLYLWREIFLEKDKIFSCYLAVSILDHYQTHIESKQYPNAAQAISRIRMETYLDVKSIIEGAKEIKHSLPFSWHFQVMNFDIFNLQTIKSVLEGLQQKMCMTVLAREAIRNMYSDLKCTCTNSCVWCNKKSYFDKPMIFLDCRTELELQSGLLKNAQILESHLWNSPDQIDSYLNNLHHLKGTTHIVLIGPSLNTGLLTREKSNLPSDSSEMVGYIYTMLMEKGYPYVSLLEGGFKNCHELLSRFKIDIQDHVPEYCYVCNPDANKPRNKVTSGIKKFAKSMSEVLKSTYSIVSNNFSFSGNQEDVFTEVLDYSNSIAYLCRKFDKVTQGKSDEEFSLLIMKNEVILGRFANNNPKKLIKIVESIPMPSIEKITSLKKFPNVLTFISPISQLCLIFNSISDAKQCISLVTKYFRDQKSNN